tara:strand:- start:2426 stop:3226 length:801 start_codon:yes stop_codon:yes gene_type:complete
VDIRVDEASALHYMATKTHILEPEVGHSMGIGTNMYDVTLRANRLMNTFDIGHKLWFLQGRWTNLIRSYLDPEVTSRFIRAAREIYFNVGANGIVTEMQFRSNKRSAKKHKWGNCLLSATFRGQLDSHIKPTLVFHSRVTYIGYISGLDIALATALANEIGNPNNISFVWKIDVAQVHAFKTLPWLYSEPFLFEQVLELNTPTAKRIQKWHDTVLRYEREGKTIEEEIYGPFRRVRTMWDLSQRGEQKPSLQVNNLTLDKLEGLDV